MTPTPAPFGTLASYSVVIPYRKYGDPDWVEDYRDQMPACYYEKPERYRTFGPNMMPMLEQYRFRELCNKNAWELVEVEMHNDFYREHVRLVFLYKQLGGPLELV